MNLFNEVNQAALALKTVVHNTPLNFNTNLSEMYQAQIYLKREDLQMVRSYKIRGAYNKLKSLSGGEIAQGIVCASAGNHAQGVAFSCHLLNIKGTIFMPITTPKQKIKQVRAFGKEKIEILLMGDTFDDTYRHAMDYCEKQNSIFIHPFDDEYVIAGQGTVGIEILHAAVSPIDYLFVPIGGGGLAAGISVVFKTLSPHTKIIGVEPLGAASMQTSIAKGKNTALENIDKFVDGAAVKKVGDKTFAICKNTLADIVLVPEGKVCSTILQLYNEEGIIVEPAGALTIAALSFYSAIIKNKNVVCVVSGGNNDITRTEEIKERSLLYEGLKHYFMIEFPQRPGALREFVNDVLGKNDDVTYFQFMKKNNRETGPATVGIELSDKKDIEALKANLQKYQYNYIYLNDQPSLLSQLI